MNNQTCSYITFHHVRFAVPINAAERSFDAPATAVHWLMGPTAHVNASGALIRTNERWSAAAFHSDRKAAETVLSDPLAMLPFLSDAVEAWHGLICPIAHHGEVNWFSGPDRKSQFVPISEDPGGTLVVITSAGYNPLTGQELAADMPRRIAFTAAAERVSKWYRTLHGNLASTAFLPHPVGRDGMTFTVWSDTASMLEAAYRPGAHRSEMDRHNAVAQFDRSSFTRGRIVDSVGTWDGHVVA